MKWTTDKPTQSGLYWIYTRPIEEADFIVDIVGIAVNDGHVSLSIPVSGYDCEEDYSLENTTHFMGPVPEPLQPGEEQDEQPEDEYLNQLVKVNRHKFAEYRFAGIPIADLTADQLRAALVVIGEQINNEPFYDPIVYTFDKWKQAGRPVPQDTYHLT